MHEVHCIIIKTGEARQSVLRCCFFFYCYRDINSLYLSPQNLFWLAGILSGQTAVTKCFHPLVMHICEHSAAATVSQGTSLCLALHHTTHVKWPHYGPSRLLYFKGQEESSPESFLWNAVFRAATLTQIIWPVTRTFSFTINMWRFTR